MYGIFRLGSNAYTDLFNVRRRVCETDICIFV